MGKTMARNREDRKQNRNVNLAQMLSTINAVRQTFLPLGLFLQSSDDGKHALLCLSLIKALIKGWEKYHCHPHPFTFDH